jgi:lysophospholipase L1-like esterase
MTQIRQESGGALQEPPHTVVELVDLRGVNTQIFNSKGLLCGSRRMSNQTYHQGPVRRFSIRSERVKRFALVVASLVLAELLLHLLGAASHDIRSVLAPPAERNARWIEDTRLRLRSNPLWLEHDARGYRNAHALAHADIVTLGDSNTYGSFVARGAAWPHLLADRTGVSVYNMGVAGYGPAQYFLQTEDALQMSPKLIIIALYFGNDFLDTFILAQRNPEIRALASLAPSNHAARPLETHKALQRLEREMSRRYPCNEMSPPATDRKQSVSSATDRWLAHHVMLYALASNLFGNLQVQLSAYAMPARSNAWSGKCANFVSRKWRTGFNIPYVSAVLDSRDPRIELGFEISRMALKRIHRRVRAAGSELLVVLLPTKESAFWNKIGKPERFAGLRRLVNDEARWRARLTEALHKEGVPVLDLLPALRDASVQPYFENADEHPNEAGHRLIAHEIATYLSDYTDPQLKVAHVKR